MGRWLVLLSVLAACGKNGGAAPDGASPDGASPDGSTEGVTVVFQGNRLANRGPIVYCRDASGALTRRIVVGPGLGATSAVCPMVDDGMVDVMLDMQTNLARFESFRHLTPGITIEADLPTGEPIHDGGTMAITVPSSPSVAGTASCGDITGMGMTAATWHAWTPCDMDTTQLLLADSAFSPTQYIFLPSVTFTANGTLDAGPWQPLGTTPSTFTGVPASTTELRENVWEILGTGASHGLAGVGEVALTDPPAGTATLDLPVPGGTGVGAGTFVLTDLEVNDHSVDSHAVFAPTTSSNLALSIDYDDQPLPRPAAVQPSATGVAWTETGTPAGDLRVISESWTKPGNTIAEWLVYDDPTSVAGSVTIYPLGADDADIDITTGDGTPGLATVMYLDYDTVDGWAAARATLPELVNIADAFAAVPHHAHQTQAQSPI